MYPQKILLSLASIVVLCASVAALGQSVGSSATQLQRSTAPAQNISSGPRIWLQANQPLPVVHRDAAMQSQVGMQGAQPLSMTSGDIDADGFEDLLVGYGTANGGVIAIHHGNIDAFAPQSDASFQAIGRGAFPSPFHLEAQTFAVPVRPDFLAVGNFVGNGNLDLAVTERGGNAVYIFPGDGKGNFGDPQTVSVSGGVTALASGKFGGGRQPTLVVGLSQGGNSALLVLAGSQQGMVALGSYGVSGAVSNILFGDFGDSGPDVAFLAGGQIEILRSSNLQLAPISLPVTVRAFALGSFIWDRNRGSQIALVAPDGSIQIAVRSEFDPRVYTVEEFQAIRQANRNHQPAPAFVPPVSFPASGWKILESFSGAAALGANQTPLIFRTRISINGADDVMVLNAFSGQLTLVSHADGQPGAPTFQSGQVSLRPYSGTPIAALPMRLNVDGRMGVMAIHQNEIAPSAMVPIPDPNFFVNTDNDPVPTSPIANACTCNTGPSCFTDLTHSCSLREAILKANGDTIMLQAGHTYQLTRGRVTATPDYTGDHGALYVNNTATIVGGDQNTTVIKWGTLTSGDTVDMVMAVNEDISPITNATGSLSTLTIQGGVNHGTHSNDGDGGCMEFDTGSSGTANLTLTNVTLQNCSTLQGNGGGIAIFNITNPGTGFATITGSLIQNNSVVEAVGAAGGGGILIAGQAKMVMTNSQVKTNHADQINGTGIDGTGGGIFLDNSSTTSELTQIHSSTISGNTTAGFGGGIATDSSLTVDQGTVVSGNTAGGDSGAATAGEGGGLYINIAAPPSTETATLTKVTITGNHARGNGGGVSTGANGSFPTDGALTMSFSRLAGNTTSASGSNLNNNGTTVTATNNWWGTNAASSTINTIPHTSGAGSGTTTFDPFIVLTHTASPDKIRINQSSTLTGDMSKDNHGNGAALSGNLDEIVGLPITFDSPVLGTIPQAQPETLGNPVPTATATFNAGGTGGLGTANATVDQAVVPVDSNLIASAIESGTTATITTVGAHNFIAGNQVTITGVGVSGYNGTFIITSVTPPTQFSYTANTSGLGNSSGGSASIGLVVLQPPSITKSFSPTTVPINSPSTITFAVTNGNVVSIDSSFTDSLPANLVVATTPNVVNTCSGTVTATAGSGSIAFANSSLAAGSCSVKVDVQSAVDNTYSNSVTIDSSDAGNGNTSSANVTVINPPHIVKAFGATTIPLNGTTSLTFTIDSNSNQNLSLNGLAFTDTLPAGLVVATPGNLNNTCGGTATAADGSSSVSLSGASVAPKSSCTVSVNVQGTTGGAKNNSVTVSSTNGGTGNTSNASVTVVGPPSISKAFGASTIPLNSSTSLSFTINNSNTVALTGVGFTDTLPAGLVISTPNGLTGSCGGGTITATQNTSTISLSGATLAASSSCTFSVNVTGKAPGVQNNTTSTVSSNEGGSGTAAPASITVVAPPSIAKAFNPASIALNATTSLTFTITNPAANAVALSGVAFTDTLPTGLTVASSTSTVCSGTLTTTAPNQIALSGATININNQCQFSVTVTGAASGQFTNTSGNVSSTNGGTGNTASANLTVASPVSITKSFGAATIPLNGTTALNFSISNPNSSSATGIAFADSLPAGLVVANPANLTNNCGGTATAASGSGSVNLSGGTLSGNASCTVSVRVQGTTTGMKNNSVTVSSTEGGTGNTSNASITVLAPPTIQKAFGAASIPLGGSTSLSFTINNPNASTLTGVGFTDVLPAGLVISTPNGLTGSCGGGTITATQNTNTISLSGASLGASASCTFSVNVTGTTAGSKVNNTGSVTSTEGGTGGSATATIHVEAPPSIAKAFSPSGIAPNGVSTLTFTITNPAANADPQAEVAFTDTLPANVFVATPNGAVNNCGGTLTAVAGSGVISLTGGSIVVASSCTVSVNVTSAVPGTYNNTSGNVSSTNGGTGNTASAMLTVAHASLTITKTHSGSFPRDSTGNNYTITVSNSVSAGPTAGTVTVTDTLPNVQHTLVPTAMSGAGWTCNLGTLTCTRSDALAPGASYPAITLTVTVPQNIRANVTNSVTVSGGGDPNSHSASDPTHITHPEK